MNVRNPWESPRLYSWDVEPFRPSCRAPQQRVGGVTDDPDRLIDRVQEALLDAPPGTRATVREVALGGALDVGNRPLRMVATARRGDRSGGVVWESFGNGLAR